MTQFDVLVVGDANPDLVLRGDVVPRWGQAEQLLQAADLVLGGSAAITACGCARLDLRVRLLAAVGADLYGDFVRRALAGRDIDTSALITVERPTGLSVILSGADRSILTLAGAIAALQPADVTDALLRSARHLHVSSVFLQPELAAGLVDVFARAKGLGVTTSLDTNWDPAGHWAGILDLLRNTDVFLPNAAELAAITGIEDVARAAASIGTTVVVKQGEGGASAWWPEGSCRVAGLPVLGVDTTGAGDSFNAGFLAGYLRGEPLPRCVAMAVVAGSLSTRASGGTSAQAFPADLAIEQMAGS